MKKFLVLATIFSTILFVQNYSAKEAIYGIPVKNGTDHQLTVIGGYGLGAQGEGIIGTAGIILNADEEKVFMAENEQEDNLNYIIIGKQKLKIPDPKENFAITKVIINTKEMESDIVTKEPAEEISQEPAEMPPAPTPETPKDMPSTTEGMPDETTPTSEQMGPPTEQPDQKETTPTPSEETIIKIEPEEKEYHLKIEQSEIVFRK
jgi:hypothetical protein